MSGSLQAQQTGSLTLAGGAGTAFPIGMGYFPSEGSRAVTLQYQFLGAPVSGGLAGYTEVLTNLVAQGVESTIQGVWIDNAANPQAVTFFVPATGQYIYVPANYQGVFPVMFTGTPQYQLTCASALIAGITRVSLLNVPVSPSQWAAGGIQGMSTLAPTFTTIQTFSAGASVLLKSGPGRLWGWNATAAVVSGALTFFGDTLTTASVANAIAALTSAPAIGTSFPLPGIPFYTGLTLTWGGTITAGTLAIWYS